jgi:hypothetical protein
MSPTRRQRDQSREARLREAEGASAEIDGQTETVNNQLSLVDKLSTGWKRVHEVNHLAQLFSQEGRLG